MVSVGDDQSEDESSWYLSSSPVEAVIVGLGSRNESRRSGADGNLVDLWSSFDEWCHGKTDLVLRAD